MVIPDKKTIVSLWRTLLSVILPGKVRCVLRKGREVFHGKCGRFPAKVGMFFRKNADD